MTEKENGTKAEPSTQAKGEEVKASVPVEIPVLDGEGENALHSRWTFWYHRRGGVAKSADYNDNIKGIGSFGTVEAFWKIYDHIVRPNEFKVTTDYHLFREGVKPTWEDPVNHEGGKWMIRLKKGIASHYWENLLMAIIGEQFDVGDEVCGAVVSVRNNEDIISVWNKNADNKEATNAIRDQMRKSLKLPPFIAIEYKKHLDAKADGSSFRNPSMVWKASTRGQDARDGGDGGGRSRFQKGDRHGNDGSAHDSGNNRGSRGPKSSWKPHRDGDNSRGGERERGGGVSTSTGDPVRDAAAAKAQADERDKGSSGAGAAARTWTNTRRERGGSGEAGGGGGGGSDGNSSGSSAFFAKKPSALPAPKPFSDAGTSRPEPSGASTDVWRRV
jgi:translation initiation factor 4E